jgi:aarF domain-containing kinase
MTDRGISPATIRPKRTDKCHSSIDRRFPGLNSPKQGFKGTALKLRNQLNTPFLIVGSAAATRGILQGQETLRRCFYFWAKAGPIVAHYKLTQFWMEHVTQPEKSHRDHVYERLHDKYAEPSLRIVLHLKGLYVKLAQVLSVRPDFVPRQYVELFSTVQDAVPQWPYENVDKLVRQSLRHDLGLNWEDVFEDMDHAALGSASIGQCHRAVLKQPWDKTGGYQGGKVVAVKVMHPGAEKRFYNDFQVFRWLCRIALPGWKPILDELNRQFMTEFDYLNEAINLDEVRINMAKSPYSRYVSVPQPLHALCSKHLLVMEMLDGKKFSDDIEERLAAAMGGNKEASRDFINKKRNGEIAHMRDNQSRNQSTNRPTNHAFHFSITYPLHRLLIRRKHSFL